MANERHARVTVAWLVKVGDKYLGDMGHLRPELGRAQRFQSRHVAEVKRAARTDARVVRLARMVRT